ncbi:MAG: protein phosphatase 2C family protein [Verrucomicrobia bacterium]|nr:protein phosphatase 2C family protein [Verrucomicrobiota bacterium]
MTRPDGSHSACIADGTGGCGYYSAFVAHMVCRYFLKTVSDEPMWFTDDTKRNKIVAESKFLDCAFDAHIRTPSSLHGESTALFVDCVPAERKNGKQMYRLQVASIGDCAAFRIDAQEKRATQLNTIHREEIKGEISSGGVIVSSGDLYNEKNAVTAIAEAAEDDCIVLVTDGFFDNAEEGKVIETVELVAFHPFFDRPIEQLLECSRFWEQSYSATLPTLDTVKTVISENAPDLTLDEEMPTPAQITKRLAAYIRFVTHSRSAEEEAYYKTIPQSQFNGTSWSGYNGVPPKTDDYMIITMKPGAR